MLLDDTNDHLSAKFKKFDLIGIPYQIILGTKTQSEKYEFKEVNKEAENLTIQEIEKKLLENRHIN